MLRVNQIKAARALLGWRQDDLARAARVGIATVRRIEGQDGLAMGNVSTLFRIEQAFERAGIRIIDADAEGGIGVRLELAKTKKKGQRPGK
jgi:transcriptional regulator with XRE-family HTH domain